MGALGEQLLKRQSAQYEAMMEHRVIVAQSNVKIAECKAKVQAIEAEISNCINQR